MRFIRNEELENLKEVTSVRLVEKKSGRFDPQGIFSSKIFGSDEYACECGELRAAWHNGEICPNCGTSILDPNDNIYRNGKFKIPNGYKIFNPIIFNILSKNIKNFVNMVDPNNKHIELDGHIIYTDEKNNTELLNFLDFSFKYQETIEKLLPEEMIKNSDNDKLRLLKDFLKENEDSVMLSNISILPLHLRPAQLTDKRMDLDPFNKYYIDMNTHIASLRTTVEVDDLNATERELFDIQKIYADFTDLVLETISKKEGIARDQILSNKINASGRAVITLKDDNDCNSVTIPKVMLTELYFPKIITNISKTLGKNYTDAYEYYMLNRFDDENEVIKKAADDVLLLKPIVLINRNPSIHLRSIQSFYIAGYTDDYTIKLPKSSLRELNADFDGDTVAVFTLDTEEAKEESKTLMAFENVISRKSFDINDALLPYQDGALALWLFDHKNK